MGIIIAVFIILILLGGVGAMLKITLPISDRVYNSFLVRTDKEKWGRVCSAPENEEQMEMWNQGIDWARENLQHRQEVMIENDGLKLYGEYYDFGYDRAVIILPGRCESLGYSYFYAPPYQMAGYNVLVIDSRCCGKSDGKYLTIGVEESKDAIKWVEFLEKTFSVKEVYFHTICVGGTAGIFALENPDCPQVVKGIVLDGCFVNFRETFKEHMIVDKRPLFPVLDMVMWRIKKNTGVNVLKQSPITSIPNMNKRVLFLFGEQDVYSVPQKSKLLFEKCASNDKRIVWFEKGGHSHLRINNKEKYDGEVVKFLRYE